jgi:DNA-binding NtrC family response regulator
MSGVDQGAHGEAQDEMLTVGTAATNDLVLTDPTVSGFHLELTRSTTGVSVKDLSSTNGTWLGDCRVERATVVPGTMLRIGNTELRISDGAGAVVEVFESDHLGDLYGTAPVMRRLMAQIERVARASVPVLMLGESGTGKELVARAIHENSPRAKGPFVTVDCGALAPTLIASELFGHERGSFTGAERQHIGAFERAQGGTIFLDEIGEMPAELQPQLLGALERRRFRRVGGRDEISVDVRVVSATNRDLRSEVNNGTFRMDLYFRLAVVVLRIPPLRERVEDIPLLVAGFLRQAGHAGPLSSVFDDDAMRTIRAHRWPGNVRELRNWVEATLALGETPELFQQAAEAVDGKAFDCGSQLLAMPYKEARLAVLDQFEVRYLGHLLEQSKHNVTMAARLARMDRSYLIKLLQKHGLREGRDTIPPPGEDEE